MVSNDRQKFVGLLLSCLGRPYVWGSNGPHSFDCSGLMVWALRSMGKIDKTDDLTAHGFFIACDLSGTPQAGDFAFYGSNGHISHIVALIDGRRIISASGGGPTTTSPAIALKQGAAVRLHESAFYRKDFIAFGVNPFMEDSGGSRFA